MQGKFLNYGQLHIASRDTNEAAPSTLETSDHAARIIHFAHSPFALERSAQLHVTSALLNSELVPKG